MAAAGWRPTVEGYLGRVIKGRIVDAVTEVKGEAAAERIRHLKKAEMATAAEQLLAGTGWVPEPLRTPGQPMTPRIDTEMNIDAASVADGSDPAVGATGDGLPRAVAAE